MHATSAFYALGRWHRTQIGMCESMTQLTQRKHDQLRGKSEAL